MRQLGIFAQHHFSVLVCGSKTRPSTAVHPLHIPRPKTEITVSGMIEHDDDIQLM